MGFWGKSPQEKMKDELLKEDKTGLLKNLFGIASRQRKQQEETEKNVRETEEYLHHKGGGLFGSPEEEEKKDS